MEYMDTVAVAIQMTTGSYDLTLSAPQGGTLENTKTALTVALIAVAVLLAAALVYLVLSGKLAGVAAAITVWCAIVLEFFFFATLVLATVNVTVLVVLVLGIALAVYAALARTQAIAKQIASGSTVKSAVKVGFRLYR